MLRSHTSPGVGYKSEQNVNFRDLKDIFVVFNYCAQIIWYWWYLVGDVSSERMGARRVRTQGVNMK